MFKKHRETSPKDIVPSIALNKKNQASAPAPAPAKAVELIVLLVALVAHSHQNCPATHGTIRNNNSEMCPQAAADAN
ncbi:hypothetical protein Tco_0213187 [Tanacetum coccineum]